MVKVSVIIPLYNSAKYVDELAVNLNKQNYHSAQFILIDDGSIDGTEMLLREHPLVKADKRFEIYSIANGGVSGARNYGLIQAKGKYIIFLDGDDYFDEKLISSYVEAIESKDTDIDFFKITLVDEMKNAPLPDKFQLNYGSAVKDTVVGQEELLSYLCDGTIKGYPVAYISKLELWQNVSFPEKYRVNEDLSALFQLISETTHLKARIHDETHYDYIMHEDSAVHSMSLEDMVNVNNLLHNIETSILVQKGHKEKISDMRFVENIGHLIWATKYASSVHKKLFRFEILKRLPFAKVSSKLKMKAVMVTIASMILNGKSFERAYEFVLKRQLQ